MSHYANGPDGPLMSIVFYAFGVSAIVMGVRLRSGIDRQGVTRPVPWLLVLAGSSLLVAGVFEVDRPTDPETTGEVIHSNTAVAAFILLVVAMVLFAIACRHDERWSSMRWTSLALAVIATGAAVATQFGRGTGTAGGMQRLLAGAVLVWLVLVALHVRRACSMRPDHRPARHRQHRVVADRRWSRRRPARPATRPRSGVAPTERVRNRTLRRPDDRGLRLRGREPADAGRRHRR